MVERLSLINVKGVLAGVWVKGDPPFKPFLEFCTKAFTDRGIDAIPFLFTSSQVVTLLVGVVKNGWGLAYGARGRKTYRCIFDGGVKEPVRPMRAIWGGLPVDRITNFEDVRNVATNWVHREEAAWRGYGGHYVDFFTALRKLFKEDDKTEITKHQLFAYYLCLVVRRFAEISPERIDVTVGAFEGNIKTALSFVLEIPSVYLYVACCYYMNVRATFKFEGGEAPATEIVRYELCANILSETIGIEKVLTDGARGISTLGYMYTPTLSSPSGNIDVDTVIHAATRIITRMQTRDAEHMKLVDLFVARKVWGGYKGEKDRIADVSEVEAERGRHALFSWHTPDGLKVRDQDHLVRDALEILTSSLIDEDDLHDLFVTLKLCFSADHFVVSEARAAEDANIRSISRFLWDSYASFLLHILYVYKNYQVQDTKLLKSAYTDALVLRVVRLYQALVLLHGVGDDIIDLGELKSDMETVVKWAEKIPAKRIETPNVLNYTPAQLFAILATFLEIVKTRVIGHVTVQGDKDYVKKETIRNGILTFDMTGLHVNTVDEAKKTVRVLVSLFRILVIGEDLVFDSDNKIIDELFKKPHADDARDRSNSVGTFADELLLVP